SYVQTQADASNLSVSYTLPDAADFGFSTLIFPSAQNLSSGITLAANIATGNKLKVEFLDSGNRKGVFLLTGTGVKSNYTLNFVAANLPVGFLASAIMQITLVADQGNMGSSGTFAIETKNLQFSSGVTGGTYTQ